MWVGYYSVLNQILIFILFVSLHSKSGCRCSRLSFCNASDVTQKPQAAPLTVEIQIDWDEAFMLLAQNMFPLQQELGFIFLSVIVSRPARPQELTSLIIFRFMSFMLPNNDWAMWVQHRKPLINNIRWVMYPIPNALRPAVFDKYMTCVWTKNVQPLLYKTRCFTFYYHYVSYTNSLWQFGILLEGKITTIFP